MSAASLSPSHRLFPPHLLHARWRTFDAAGYSQPVTGVSSTAATPAPPAACPWADSTPAASIMEPNGMFGYSTVFNHLAEPRALLNLPMLGLACRDEDGADRSWILISDTLGKRDTPQPAQSAVTFPPTDYAPLFDEIGLAGADIADSIDYWGHYPIVDMEFNSDAPVAVGLRAWSPFIPGDTSRLHDARRRLRNPPAQPRPRRPQRHARLQLSRLRSARRRRLGRKCSDALLTGPLNGVHVQSQSRGDAWEMAYVLAALDDGAPVQHAAQRGGALNADKASLEPHRRPAADRLQRRTAARPSRIPFDLEPGASEDRARRAGLACAPLARRRQSRPTRRPRSSPTCTPATTPTRSPPPISSPANHKSLLQRVIAWQEALYTAPELPGWLADALINKLHLIPECSIWGQAQPPLGDWCAPEDGLFGLNECPRGCPQIECLPCSFYGNIPLVYFFPEAALSTLRGYKAYQFPDGRPPWIFGGITATNEANRPGYGLSAPDVGYQTVLNGACYVIMLDRYWQASGDDAVLAEFWDSLKHCNDFAMNLRPAYGPAQVMAMPAPGTDSHGLGDTEWFEAPEPGWKGYVTHAGGVRMAQVQIMRRMATAMERRRLSRPL